MKLSFRSNVSLVSVVGVSVALVLSGCGRTSNAPDIADLPRETVPVTTVPPTTLPPKPIKCDKETAKPKGDSITLTKSGLTITAKGAEKPKIEIPKTPDPKEVICEIITEGTGEVIKAGDSIKANYVGVIRKDGKQFDASYDRGEPATFPVGVGGLIQGWDRTLPGLKFGSRVVLSIPADQGYGSQGNPGAGITGTDVLIFVIDVIEKG
jgi:peptidylprolyl isomerase